jgi:flavodoxin
MARWISDERARRRAAEALEGPTLRRDRGPTTLRRRSLLRGAVAGVAGAVIGVQLSGCSDSPPRPMAGERDQGPTGPSATGTSQPTATGSDVLVAYFSRAGENYYYGGRTNLTVGNTEVLAGMIGRLIACDVHCIEPADPYPDDYEETVARNVREQNAGIRPAIANPLASIERYDVVLLGSPIWSVRLPMIMSTFVERFSFAGKTVFPFVTYAVSGLGTTVRDYAASCPDATIGEGLAVRGEEVRDAGAAAEAWLRRIGLLTR